MSVFEEVDLEIPATINFLSQYNQNLFANLMILILFKKKSRTYIKASDIYQNT